jgi:hypothetical protein
MESTPPHLPPVEDFKFSKKNMRMRSHPNSSNLGENSCILESCAEFIGKQSKKAAWPVKKESLLSIETSGITHSTPNREIGILDYTLLALMHPTVYIKCASVSATKIASQKVTTPTTISRLCVRSTETCEKLMFNNVQIAVTWNTYPLTRVDDVLLRVFFLLVHTPLRKY